MHVLLSLCCGLLLRLQAVPESLEQYNLLSVTLGEEAVPILGLRVWNYNKNPADTARGVKRCVVLAGGYMCVQCRAAFEWGSRAAELC